MIGPSNELQASGIVPCRKCNNEKCGALSTASNLRIGDIAASIAPMAPSQPTNPQGLTREEAEVKMAALLEMKAKVEQLEKDMVEPKEKATKDEGKTNPDEEEAHDGGLHEDSKGGPLIKPPTVQ